MSHSSEADLNSTLRSLRQRRVIIDRLIRAMEAYARLSEPRANGKTSPAALQARRASGHSR
jgi:hypothetical protein